MVLDDEKILDDLEDHINKYSAEGVTPYLSQHVILKIIELARIGLRAQPEGINYD